MSRRAGTIWIAAIAAAALWTVGMGDARAKERRVATLAPAGSAWMNILEKGANKIAEATGGRVKVKWYPGGTQGDEKDVVRKIRQKQLDGAALTTVGLSLIYPGVRVMQLPFLFESVEEVDYVRAKMWPYFEKKFEEQGFKLLYPGDVGWAHMYAKRSIQSFDDLKKVTFWAWTDDPIVRAYFEQIGVSSVPLGVPEVLTALKTGRIDGCYGSPLAAVALQWYTEVSYATVEPFGYTVGAMVVRLDAWNEMSPEDRATEQKIGKKIGAMLIKRVRRDNDRAKRAMQKNGIRFVDTPQALRSKLEAEAQKLWKRLAGKVYTEQELAMVLKYRDEFRKKRASK